jgi:hypothetical protein
VPKNVSRAISNKTTIYQASALFGFAGLLSSFIISVVVLASSFGSGTKFKSNNTGLNYLISFYLPAFLFDICCKKEKATLCMGSQ